MRAFGAEFGHFAGLAIGGGKHRIWFFTSERISARLPSEGVPFWLVDLFASSPLSGRG